MGLNVQSLLPQDDADVILFDRTGRLLSRHRFKYVLDEDLSGFRASDDIPDVLRVWRLEKI